MLVEKIATTNFRNLANTEVSFSPGINLLIGENGHGKTNLLEAIAFFKFGRSFRTSRDTELIRFDEKFCRVETQCSHEKNGREKYSVSIDDCGTKKIKTGGNNISRLSELVGRYPVVLFGPSDLKLVSGPPGERRRFVDMVASMTDGGYVELLKKYRRVVEQRNAALKARAGGEELKAWNAELVEKGSELVVRRYQTLKKIGKHVTSHAAELGTPFSFSLKYSSSLHADVETDPEVGVVEGIFAAQLEKAKREELKKCTTLVGPHRDDVIVDLRGRELKKYGSQGQKRLFALLAKLAEKTHIENELGEPGVLMLDDVFSEFDKEITARLQKAFEGGRQVFVTSPVSLDWEDSRETRVFYVRAGHITT